MCRLGCRCRSGPRGLCEGLGGGSGGGGALVFLFVCGRFVGGGGGGGDGGDVGD